MTPKTKALAVILSLSILFVGCGQQASKPEKPEKPETKDTLPKPDTTAIPVPQKPIDTVAKKYNVLDKVSGTYVLTKKILQYEENDIPKRSKITLLGKKKLKIDNYTFDYYLSYEKKDTVLSFGGVTPDSEDWTGGGEIRINGNELTFIWLSGPEQNNKFIYRKK
jgi:hypothetical protein